MQHSQHALHRHFIGCKQPFVGAARPQPSSSEACCIEEVPRFEALRPKIFLAAPQLPAATTTDGNGAATSGGTSGGGTTAVVTTAAAATTATIGKQAAGGSGEDQASSGSKRGRASKGRACFRARLLRFPTSDK